MEQTISNAEKNLHLRSMYDKKDIPPSSKSFAHVDAKILALRDRANAADAYIQNMNDLPEQIRNVGKVTASVLKSHTIAFTALCILTPIMYLTVNHIFNKFFSKP